MLILYVSFAFPTLLNQVHSCSVLSFAEVRGTNSNFKLTKLISDFDTERWMQP